MEDRGKWVKNTNNPVMSATLPWEKNCVYEPKVIVEQNGSLTMFYGAGWDSPAIGRATSTDGGNTWVKNPNPVIGNGIGGATEACHHSARKLANGKYEIIFSNSDLPPASFYRALSDDGITFVTHPVSILQYDSNYNFPANPCIVNVGSGREVMLYTSLASAGTWVLLQAQRADADGWVWVKDSRPPASSAQIGTGVYDIVTVTKVGDWYYGHSINGTNGNLPTDIYTFRSKDLYNWEKLNESLPSIARSQAFEVDQCADPCMVSLPGKMVMFYSGMNNPAAYGAIGRAEFVGTVEDLFSAVSNPTVPYNVEALIVGGGAGASNGNNFGGGGGGGEVRVDTISITPGQSYSVTIGGSAAAGVNGNATTFVNTANGGVSPGLWGTTGGNSGTKTGGASYQSSNGGGGGASSVSNGGAANSTTGGSGANGTNYQGVVYGSGGGGAGAYYSGSGGVNAGSGARNAAGQQYGTHGTANRGGGGGGSVNTVGGTGSSGIVTIRYSGTPRGTGGTITQAGGFTTHTFTSSGTYTA